MKPAWDQLMEEYKDSPSFLIADVDCTADGKALCTARGVRGYPTIKYGDPADLQDYKGGRDFDSLKKFVDGTLTPVCSPINLDACSEEQKGALKVFQSMGEDDLRDALQSKEKDLKEGIERHEKQMAKLEEEFSAFKKEKSSAIGIMKVVKMSLKSSKDEL
jgi:hypothetical protein